MKPLIVFLATAAIAGCGVDTAATAVTAAAIKKQEMEEAKRTQERARQKIEQATEQAQQRAQQGSER